MATLLKKEMAVIGYVNEVFNQIDKKHLSNKLDEYAKIGIHALYVIKYTFILEVRGSGAIVNNFTEDDLNVFFKERNDLFTPYYGYKGWHTLNLESLKTYKSKKGDEKNYIISELIYMLQPKMNYPDSFYEAMNLFDINEPLVKH